MRFDATRVLVAASLTVLVPLAGCGGSAASRAAAVDEAKIAQDERAIVDLTEPSKPLPVERFARPDAAHIAPGDVLELRVLGFPELSGEFRVAADGRINLSLVGSVQASGKSAEELDRDLTNALATYYRNLDLAVNVRELAERNVYVLGEVTRPGRIEFRTGERVIHALADAGGMSTKAREDGIILMRREEDGKDHVYRLDFSRLHERIAPRDVYLQPGDVVFAPKSRFGTIFDFVNPFLEALSRITTTALVADDLGRRTGALTITR